MERKPLHGKFVKNRMNQQRLFKERNGGFDICSTGTSTQKKLNRKKH